MLRYTEKMNFLYLRVQKSILNAVDGLDNI